MDNNIPTNYVGSVYPTDDPAETYYIESLQNLDQNLNFVGNDNMFAGNGALASIENGSDNVALGVNTLAHVTNSDNNIAIGTNALELNIGSNNICIGLNSGQGITTGGANIFIGTNAGVGDPDFSPPLATGNGNIIIGQNSQLDAINRNNCILIGTDAVSLPALPDGQLVMNNLLKATMSGVPAIVANITEYLPLIINGEVRYIPIFTTTGTVTYTPP